MSATLLHFIRDIAHAVAASFAAAVLLFASMAAGAAEPFKPEVGQPGKDVIWVPTPERAVERMLHLARVGPDDFLIDLGSGDGRIVIAAVQRFGARGLGVDLNPDMVRLSEHRANQAGVSDRAKFYGDKMAAGGTPQEMKVWADIIAQAGIKPTE